MPLAVDPPGLLANDTDADSPLTAVLVEAPLHGQLELQPDGAFVYTPDPGFSGTDTFRYAATDASQAHEATVQLAVASDEEPLEASEGGCGCQATRPLSGGLVLLGALGVFGRRR